MWARLFEFMLALWLSVSPFIFRHGPDETFLWANDLTCATIIAVLSLSSFKPRIEKIHLVNIAVGFWLIGVGAFRAEPPPPPAMQNQVVVGLLLLMFAVIPSRSDDPPRAWQQFYENREHETK